MSSRPSDALLRLIRDVAQKKGLNTAALARVASIERTRLKHLLAGSEPMLVDEFISIAQALEISATDMGLAAPATAGQEEDEEEYDDDGPVLADAPVPLRAVGRRERAPTMSYTPDPFGNHAQQALRLGFALGCDLFFIVDVKQLGESGVPRSVLARYPEHMPIRLDAAFHKHNDPQFLPVGLQLTVSFDSVYTCLFPWASFRQISFFPLPPSEPDEPEGPKPEESKASPRRGHLRLVE